MSKYTTNAACRESSSYYYNTYAFNTSIPDINGLNCRYLKHWQTIQLL